MSLQKYATLLLTIRASQEGRSQFGYFASVVDNWSHQLEESECWCRNYPSSGTLDAYFKHSDNQTVLDTERRRLRKQTRAQVDSHEKPATITGSIDAWLKTWDQTVIEMQESLAHLKTVFAAQGKKELDLFINETNADLHLWHAYVDGVEGKHKTWHTKSVHLSGKKMEKFTDLEARLSNFD